MPTLAYPASAPRTPILFLILVLHLLALYLFNKVQMQSGAESHKTTVLFWIPKLANPIAIPAPPIASASHEPRKSSASKMIPSPTSTTVRAIENSTPDNTAKVDPIKPTTSNNPFDAATPNYDIKAITKDLEQEEARQAQVAKLVKPPNQVAREYWDKKNHPFNTKWEALADQIEKAGVQRGNTMETYTAADGTQITKWNGNCYKNADTGRSYLQQPEIRKVICPR